MFLDSCSTIRCLSVGARLSPFMELGTSNLENNHVVSLQMNLEENYALMINDSEFYFIYYKNCEVFTTSVLLQS